MQNMQGIRAIDSLDEATSIIKNEMESMFDGFIAIGFYLKKIRDDRMYLQKGYSSIFDYSDQVFKLTRFQTTRFMEVNDVYSIGGYSPEIDDKWKGYGSSKLVEMMALPEEIREMVPQQATVREIRDAKKVVRETKDKYSPQMNLCDAAQEPDENWMKLLAKMLGKDRSIFMAMIEWERSDIGNDRTGIEKEVQTLVNPSGFQVLRFETANIWMTENCIRVNPYKVNGEVPNSVEYTYIDLAMAFEEIYYPNYPDISEPAQEIYERIYGEPLYEKKEEPKEEPKQEQTPGKPRDSKKQKAKNNDSRPVHQVEEPKEQLKEQSEEQIPGQTELTKDFPEYCPDAMNPPEEPCEEVQEGPVEAAYGTRLQFLSKCTDEEKGAYMAAVMEDRIRKMNNTSFKIFVEGKFWKDLLTAEVDEEGREIECVN